VTVEHLEGLIGIMCNIHGLYSEVDPTCVCFGPDLYKCIFIYSFNLYYLPSL
jgi:hypothetical protein